MVTKLPGANPKGPSICVPVHASFKHQNKTPRIRASDKKEREREKNIHRLFFVRPQKREMKKHVSQLRPWDPSCVCPLRLVERRRVLMGAGTGGGGARRRMSRRRGETGARRRGDQPPGIAAWLGSFKGTHHTHIWLWVKRSKWSPGNGHMG